MKRDIGGKPELCRCADSVGESIRATRNRCHVSSRSNLANSLITAVGNKHVSCIVYSQSAYPAERSRGTKPIGRSTRLHASNGLDEACHVNSSKPVAVTHVDVPRGRVEAKRKRIRDRRTRKVAVNGCGQAVADGGHAAQAVSRHRVRDRIRDPVTSSAIRREREDRVTADACRLLAKGQDLTLTVCGDAHNQAHQGGEYEEQIPALRYRKIHHFSD
ncbi:MAG: hypothetical protein WC538_21710 [Thermoanaerobaculia bacterium]